MIVFHTIYRGEISKDNCLCSKFRVRWSFGVLTRVWFFDHKSLVLSRLVREVEVKERRRRVIHARNEGVDWQAVGKVDNTFFGFCFLPISTRRSSEIN